MGLNQVRNGKIIETRMIESEAEENMTVEEYRSYMEKLEEEIRVLKAGK